MEDIDIIDLATIAPLPATAAPATPSAAPEAVIRVRDLVVGFGDKLIMNGLDLDVYRGEVLGFVGGSGTGKSVLTRTILGLIRKRAGKIEMFGENADALPRDAAPRHRAALGRHVPAGRAVLRAYREAEHPGADARISAPVAAADGRARACSRSRWSG